MGIGKTLSDILSEQNRNPNEFAETIGESPSTIYSIIRRDNMKVDITILAKICSELNVDVDTFCTNNVDTFKKSNKFHVSNHEKKIILAYRQKPDVQNAVNILLGITEIQAKDKHIIEV